MKLRPAAPLIAPRQVSDLLDIPFSDEQLRAIAALDPRHSVDEPVDVEAGLAPGVIIAGAGTGKTSVMAARVVWLVGSGRVRPDQVLGLTFTNKAAAELSARIEAGLDKAGFAAGEDEGRQTVMTYDAFAARIVADFGALVGIELQPVMVTGAQRTQLAARVAQTASGPFDKLGQRSFSWVVSRTLELDASMASHLVSPRAVKTETADFLAELDQAPTRKIKGSEVPYAAVVDAAEVARERLELVGLVEDYRRLKRQLGVAEFADQMAIACEVAARFPSVGATLRQQYRVVLLDEYQDTSSAQARLLRTLFAGTDADHGRGHPVTAVGDPFQAIYGWRGAAASNITEFSTDFPCADGTPAAEFTLTINRRSGQRILDVGNAVAAPLRQETHTVAELVAPRGAPPGEVCCADFQTRSDETTWIADRIVDDLRSGRVKRWRDIAVLVRRNDDLGLIFHELRKRDVPCEIVGIGGLLAVPEVSHVVATLRLLIDVAANPEVVELLSGPRWRVGPADLEALGAHAAKLTRSAQPSADQSTGQLAGISDGGVSDPARDLCLLEAIADLTGSRVSQAGREHMRRWATELAELRTHIDEPMIDLVQRVIAVTGLDAELASRPDGADRSSRAQLDAFVAEIGDYVDVEGDRSLRGLLAYLDAERATGEGLTQATPSESDSVKLMSVHRSKGLEWDVVYLPSLIDEVFPSTRVSDNWVEKPQVIPASLRGDADSVPQLQEVSNPGMKDFKKDLAEANRAAEHRLAYVAATRARRLLIASCHWWRPDNKKKRQPSEYFTVVRNSAERHGGVLATVEQHVETNPDSLGGRPIEWPEAIDPADLERRHAAADLVSAFLTGRPPLADPPLTPEEAELVDEWTSAVDDIVQRVSRGAPRIALPTSLSVSNLMRARTAPGELPVELVRPMPHKPSVGNRIGTRFHEWVERHYGLAPTLDAPEVELSASRPSDDRALQRLIEQFLAGPYADRTPIAVEEAFVLVVDGQLVRGRIDAIFDSTSPEFDYQIVDWKTFEGPADSLQLSLYRQAWAQAHGVDPQRVDAVFYHVRSGVVERPDRFWDRDELSQLLAGLVVDEVG